jgi:hypothetical protein
MAHIDELSTLITLGQPLALDGLVHHDRPWVLRVTDDHGNVARYTYSHTLPGYRDGYVIVPDFRAVKDAGFRVFSRGHVTATMDEPHPIEVLESLAAQRAAFTRGRRDTALAWADANGISHDEIFNGDLDEADEAAVSRVAVDTSTANILGDGSQSLYVYNTTGTAEGIVKIGYSVNGVAERIEQQIGTAMPGQPRLLLIIKTDHARALERVVHGILEMQGRRLTGGGAEWFRATPEMVRQIAEFAMSFATQE